MRDGKYVMGVWMDRRVDQDGGGGWWRLRAIPSTGLGACQAGYDGFVDLWLMSGCHSKMGTWVACVLGVCVVCVPFGNGSQDIDMPSANWYREQAWEHHK
jgi:hypothetical protein